MLHDPDGVAEPIDDDGWGPCRTWPDMTCWSRRMCTLLRECMWRPVTTVPDPAGYLSMS